MTTPTRIIGPVNLTIPRLTRAVGLTLARMEGPVGLEIERIVGETGAAQPVVPSAPVNVVAPVVSGTPTEGETLSCTTGTWTGTLPITYSYQWYRTSGLGSTPIGGATASTYTLTAAEVGEDVWCVVTATNAAGSADESSNNVGPIASAAVAPVNTVAPVASGVVRIGEVLSCTSGTWTDATTYAYQWTRDGVAIGGATATTHTVVAADIAALIACEVTATGPGGVSAPEPSAALAHQWRDILLMAPEFVWAFSDQPALTVGTPVPALIDPYGVTITNTATTARQATYQADCLRFDGADDRYTLATPGTLANLAALNRTGSLIIAHTTDYAAVGGLSDKMWFAAGAAANLGSRVCLSYARRDTFLSLGRSVQFFDASVQRNYVATTGPASTPVCHVETYSTSQVSKHLLTTAGRTDETGAAVGAQTIAPTIVTIGCGVNGGSPSFYRNGDLRFIAHFGRVLTTGEIDTIRAVMIANGVVT